MGYGHAKQELFRVINRELEPLRERYNELMADPDEIEQILTKGGARARSIAEETIRDVRARVGVMR